MVHDDRGLLHRANGHAAQYSALDNRLGGNSRDDPIGDAIVNESGPEPPEFSMDGYSCSVVQHNGTGTSRLLQPMFDAWAGTAGVRLFPGTAYLCADSRLQFPGEFIDLAPFEHLHGIPNRRPQQGYAPRLYAVAVGGALLAWVYRWSADDVHNGFLGKLGQCEPANLAEVVASVSIRRAIGTVAVSLRFLAQSGFGGLTTK